MSTRLLGSLLLLGSVKAVRVDDDDSRGRPFEVNPQVPQRVVEHVTLKAESAARAKGLPQQYVAKFAGEAAGDAAAKLGGTPAEAGAHAAKAVEEVSGGIPPSPMLKAEVAAKAAVAASSAKGDCAEVALHEATMAAVATGAHPDAAAKIGEDALPADAVGCAASLDRQVKMTQNALKGYEESTAAARKSAEDAVLHAAETSVNAVKWVEKAAKEAGERKLAEEMMVSNEQLAGKKAFEEAKTREATERAATKLRLATIQAAAEKRVADAKLASSARIQEGQVAAIANLEKAEAELAEAKIEGHLTEIAAAKKAADVRFASQQAITAAEAAAAKKVADSAEMQKHLIANAFDAREAKLHNFDVAMAQKLMTAEKENAAKVMSAKQAAEDAFQHASMLAANGVKEVKDYTEAKVQASQQALAKTQRDGVEEEATASKRIRDANVAAVGAIATAKTDGFKEIDAAAAKARQDAHDKIMHAEQQAQVNVAQAKTMLETKVASSENDKRLAKQQVEHANKQATRTISMAKVALEAANEEQSSAELKKAQTQSVFDALKQRTQAAITKEAIAKHAVSSALHAQSVAFTSHEKATEANQFMTASVATKNTPPAAPLQG